MDWVISLRKVKKQNLEVQKEMGHNDVFLFLKAQEEREV